MIPEREEESVGDDQDNYFSNLERVNKNLVQLVKLLIDHIKGDETEYEYQYGQGWTVEQHNTMKEQLDTEDPGDQLKAVKELLEKYRLKEE